MYKQEKVKEPMPHLIIVADEFAELKKEKPEFMAKLVKIAQIGRSLGIHLILATQKPSGVVDEHILANTRFRICLKVADATDSREMLKTSDAARIFRAGRAYIKVGERIYEQIQSYWSGAPCRSNGERKESAVKNVQIVHMNGMRESVVARDRTIADVGLDELKAISLYLKKTAEKIGIKKWRGPLIPELPTQLYLKAIAGEKAYSSDGWKAERSQLLRIPVGIYDLPEKQKQGIQMLDFEEMGHIGIYGGPGSGKTEFLKTALLSVGIHFTPEEVQIYIIDCGGWSLNVFSDMPHVGGVVLNCEESKLEKLEQLMWKELEDRKKRFLSVRVSNLKDYREMIDTDLAAVILAVDNLSTLLNLYPDMESLFSTLAKDGAAYGIHLLFSGNSVSSIRYRIQQNVKGAIAFELTDPGEYSMTVGRLQGTLRPSAIKGRGFYKADSPVVFQAALYMEGKDERERVNMLQTLMQEMRNGWAG